MKAFAPFEEIGSPLKWRTGGNMTCAPKAERARTAASFVIETPWGFGAKGAQR